jgi:conjugal transfer mating pair stabilization protein TraG
MDLTLYVLGDLHTFVAGLNAIAMLFNPAVGTWTGGGAFGFGSVVGIGLLITLVITMISGILRQEVRMDVILVLIIAYSIMFVPKTSLQVEDMYSGNIGVVDNVPIGVALPAAIISTLTHKIAVNMETAFSTTSTTYSAQTTNGFLQPLKTLLSLRAVNGCAAEFVCNNMVNYMRYCTVDAAGNRINVNDLTGVPDGVSTVLEAGTVAALTIFQDVNNPGGTYITCAEAGLTINNQALNWINNAYVPGESSSSSFSNLVNSRRSAGSRTDVFATTDANQINTAIANHLAGASFSRDRITLNILYGQLMQKGLSLANTSNPAVVNEVFMNDAMSQWQADAAGEGSMFVNTMIPAMNILQFLFFALAPLIALVVVSSGLKGLTILGSYALFGAWTQTWLPVSSIINFYVQSQFDDILQSLPDGSMASINNIQPLYTLLATKLAVGSAMLASTPVITLAVMSGSMFALTSVAQRASGAGGAGYVNEKEIAPSANDAGLVKQARAATDAARIVGGGSQMLTAPVLGSMAEISTQGALGESSAYSRKLAQQFASLKAAETGKMVAAFKEFSKQSETGNTSSRGNKQLLDSFFGAAHAETRSQAIDKKFGHGAAVTMAAAGALRAQGQLGQAKALIAGFDASTKGETKDSFEKAFGSHYDNRFEQNDGTRSSNVEEASTALTAAIKQAGSAGDRFQSASNLSDKYSKQESDARESANSADRKVATSGNAKFGGANLVAGVNPDGGPSALGAATSAGENAGRRAATTPEGRAALNELLNETNPAMQQMRASSMVNQVGTNPERAAVGAAFLGAMYSARSQDGALYMTTGGREIMDQSLSGALNDMGNNISKLAKNQADVAGAAGDVKAKVGKGQETAGANITNGKNKVTSDVNANSGAAKSRIKSTQEDKAKLKEQGEVNAGQYDAQGKVEQEKAEGQIDQMASDRIAGAKAVKGLADMLAVADAVNDSVGAASSLVVDGFVASMAVGNSLEGGRLINEGKNARFHAGGAIRNAQVMVDALDRVSSGGEGGGLTKNESGTLREIQSSMKNSGIEINASSSLEQQLSDARDFESNRGASIIKEGAKLTSDGNALNIQAADVSTQMQKDQLERSQAMHDSTVNAVNTIVNPKEAANRLVSGDTGKGG